MFMPISDAHLLKVSAHVLLKVATESSFRSKNMIAHDSLKIATKGSFRGKRNPNI